MVQWHLEHFDLVLVVEGRASRYHLENEDTHSPPEDTHRFIVRLNFDIAFRLYLISFVICHASTL